MLRENRVLPNGIEVPEDQLSFGAILGQVELVNCVRGTDASVCGDPFCEGPWCWRFCNPYVFARAIPYRGQLGVFEVAEELLADWNQP
jgi:hypothetical protein